MEGELVHELEVSVAARVVWDVYGGLRLSKLSAELFPQSVESVQVVEGDGGVGTVLHITPKPENATFTSFKEKFTKIDNEKRIKETEMIEGGYMDRGFSLYRLRVEILDKEANSCVIKSTIEYKVDSAANASLVSIHGVAIVAAAIGKYLSENNI